MATNDNIIFRVKVKEKKEIARQAKQDGHQSVAGYLLFLHRNNVKQKIAEQKQPQF